MGCDLNISFSGKDWGVRINKRRKRFYEEKVLALLLSACMVISMAGCSSRGKKPLLVIQEEAEEKAQMQQLRREIPPLPEGFNATGMPIMNEKITLKVWIEGRADIDWEQNRFVKRSKKNPISNFRLFQLLFPMRSEEKSDAGQRGLSGSYSD